MTNVTVAENLSSDPLYGKDELLSVATAIVKKASFKLKDHFSGKGGFPESLRVTSYDLDRICLSSDPEAACDSAYDYVIRTFEIGPVEQDGEESDSAELIKVIWAFYCIGPEHAGKDCEGETFVRVESFDDYAGLSDDEFMERMMTAIDKDERPTGDCYAIVNTSILGAPALARLQSIADGGNPEAAYAASIAFFTEDFEDDELCRKYLKQAALSGKSAQWYILWICKQRDSNYSTYFDNWTKFENFIIFSLSLVRESILDAGRLFAGDDYQQVHERIADIFNNWVMEGLWAFREEDWPELSNWFKRFGKNGYEGIVEFLKTYPSEVMDALGEDFPKSLRRISAGGEFALFGYTKEEFLEKYGMYGDAYIDTQYADTLKDLYGLDFAVEFLTVLDGDNFTYNDENYKILQKYVDKSDNAELADMAAAVAACRDYGEEDYDDYYDNVCHYCSIAISRGMEFTDTILYRSETEIETALEHLPFMKKHGLEKYIPEFVTACIENDCGSIFDIDDEEIEENPWLKNLDYFFADIPSCDYPENDDDVDKFVDGDEYIGTVKEELEDYLRLEKWIAQEEFLPKESMLSALEESITTLKKWRNDFASEHKEKDAKYYQVSMAIFSKFRASLDRMKETLERR